MLKLIKSQGYKNKTEKIIIKIKVKQKQIQYRKRSKKVVFFGLFSKIILYYYESTHTHTHTQVYI